MSNFEGAMDNARQFTETLCQIIESLEAEIAELRAGQGRWPETVTAETIRASEPGSTWEDRHGAAWEWTGSGMAYHSQFGDLGEESLTGYVVHQSGPFTRSTAAPRGDYSTTPRLTVHALNVAPVGSTVRTPGKTRTKRDDGTWFTVSTFGQHTRTSEELLALGYANATLTYPERGDDE